MYCQQHLQWQLTVKMLFTNDFYAFPRPDWYLFNVYLTICYETCEQWTYLKTNEWTDFCANFQKRSLQQWHEIIYFRDSGGQTFKSHEAKDRFGCLVETSFSTPLGQVGFLVRYNLVGIADELLTAHFSSVKRQEYIHSFAFYLWHNCSKLSIYICSSVKNLKSQLLEEPAILSRLVPVTTIHIHLCTQTYEEYNEWLVSIKHRASSTNYLCFKLWSYVDAHRRWT